MTFAELLKRKDGAIQYEADCLASLAKAITDHELATTAAAAEVEKQEAAAAAAGARRLAAIELRTAATRAALAKSSRDASQAGVTRLAAQQAVFDELAAKGERYVTEPNGTITVYRAKEISATSPGWQTTQPIAGD